MTYTLKDVRSKIFQRSEFVKTFVRVRLWEPYARNAKYFGGHYARFEDKLCGRPAKLLNLVSVVFRPLEGRRCDEIQFESVHLGNYYSRKLSFTLKIVQNSFLRTTKWLRWSKFSKA